MIHDLTTVNSEIASPNLPCICVATIAEGTAQASGGVQRLGKRAGPRG